MGSFSTSRNESWNRCPCQRQIGRSSNQSKVCTGISSTGSSSRHKASTVQLKVGNARRIRNGIAAWSSSRVSGGAAGGSSGIGNSSVLRNSVLMNIVRIRRCWCVDTDRVIPCLGFARTGFAQREAEVQEAASCILSRVEGLLTGGLGGVPPFSFLLWGGGAAVHPEQGRRARQRCEARVAFSEIRRLCALWPWPRGHTAKVFLHD